MRGIAKDVALPRVILGFIPYLSTSASGPGWQAIRTGVGAYTLQFSPPAERLLAVTAEVVTTLLGYTCVVNLVDKRTAAIAAFQIPSTASDANLSFIAQLLD